MLGPERNRVARAYPYFDMGFVSLGDGEKRVLNDDLNGLKVLVALDGTSRLAIPFDDGRDGVPAEVHATLPIGAP